jgi:hypothetical protein
MLVPKILSFLDTYAWLYIPLTCHLALSLLLEHTTQQTFDQQLYAIAKQFEWAKQNTFKTHFLRLGSFHTMSCFVASIGKLWGDGGLKDLLIESSVYAASKMV